MAGRNFYWGDIVSNLDLIIVSLANISINIFELKTFLEEATKITSNLHLVEKLTDIQEKINDIARVARSARDYARIQNRIASHFRELLNLDNFAKELFYIITNGSILYDLVQEHITNNQKLKEHSDLRRNIDNLNKSFKKSLEEIKLIYLVIHSTINN